MTSISLEKVIEMGVQAGVKEAIERIEKDKEEKIKFKKDRRLRNTEILLRNYNGFVKHFNEAVFSQEQVEAEDPDSMLEEMCMDFDSNYDEIYINAIKRTKTRTKIMITHIERIMGYYKYQAETTKDEKLRRRYEIIDMIYFQNKTYEDICEELDYSTKTIVRDKKKAIEELSVLFFGIDGLKMSF